MIILPDQKVFWNQTDNCIHISFKENQLKRIRKYCKKAGKPLPKLNCELCEYVAPVNSSSGQGLLYLDGSNSQKYLHQDQAYF